MKFYKDLTIGYAAGSLGGLFHALIFWAVVRYGIAADIGVHFSVPQHLSQAGHLISFQVIWGGIFGFLLAISIWGGAWFKRGLLLSLVPTLVMLLYVFPFVTGGGMFGLDHGNFAFVVVLVVNAIYGLITSAWFSYVGGKG